MRSRNDLAAIIRRARRDDPYWSASVVRNATASQRRKLLTALVDGWGVDDTLKQLSRAVVALRVERRKLVNLA